MPPLVTKETLDCEVSRSLGVPIKTVRMISRAFIDGLRDALAAGAAVRIAGLGRFSVSTSRQPPSNIVPYPYVRNIVRFARGRVLARALAERNISNGETRRGTRSRSRTRKGGRGRLPHVRQEA
ncbi:HU family DNA-binding protein [Pendulispora rubella]|uniref:HU family DNA-binding protein n=1 Tax=Pendulispora rubella TaxID=2741070 RepID=A0ABZ2KXS3_9BACT